MSSLGQSVERCSVELPVTVYSAEELKISQALCYLLRKADRCGSW